TLGFRDVLELRRMRMPHLYDYFWNKPPTLVPRHLRFEVAERMAADGTVLVALADAEALRVAALLRDANVEAVAVCLLHAHLHPGHEERLGALLRDELPGLPISLSSEILREEQEYERTAKASRTEDGRVSRSQEYEVGASLSAGSRLLRGSGELIRIPTIDIAEVGAGGGSLAWLDPAGALQVGPRSAGAHPGPACYGL